MVKTPNYDLTLSDGFERINVTVLNDNFSKIDDALFKKVDKEEGKSLMSEEEHEKLENIDMSAVEKRFTQLEARISLLEAELEVLKQDKE